LAKTGGRTLLIDFDLRKPTLHHIFDVPRAPGVSEFLRGESELGAIVRTTNIAGLSVLTSGAQFSDSLGSLSNGVTRSLFKTVREQFEFVVVDGSPILPVVDSLLASQHVDSVVLSIRRDVSQIAPVQFACDQLAQFGVDEVVAVLTGSKEALNHYYGDLEQLVSSTDDKCKPR
jgi:capsular exopolysaccharide synthesis family protein